MLRLRLVLRVMLQQPRLRLMPTQAQHHTRQRCSSDRMPRAQFKARFSLRKRTCRPTSDNAIRLQLLHQLIR